MNGNDGHLDVGFFPTRNTNAFIGASVLVNSSTALVVMRMITAKCFGARIFIIDWPTIMIWILITWFNRIHFVCEFQFHVCRRYFTRSENYCYIWIAHKGKCLISIFWNEKSKFGFILIWICADHRRQCMTEWYRFLSINWFEYERQISRNWRFSNQTFYVRLHFFSLILHDSVFSCRGRSSHSLQIDVTTIWLVIGFNIAFVWLFIFIHIFIVLIFNAENF